jgi:Lar family restriction alleviation protein
VPAARTDLSPCPFCTCKAVELETETDGPRADYFWIECPACNACGPLQTSDALAIEFWNARTASTSQEQLHMPAAKKPAPLKITSQAHYDRLQEAGVTPFTNVHPVDELAAVREEIKLLQQHADDLRDQLLAEGADLNGDQYVANIVPGVRESLDRKAITEAFGEAAIAPFIKATHYQTVKLMEK